MRFKSEKGQAMAEFALILPLLLLLICGIIDFGWIFGNQLAANFACREAARYTAIHYYDSNTDNDEAIAREIVLSRAPMLNPTVTVTASFGSVKVQVRSNVTILTPILSALLSADEYTVSAECIMRLE